MSKHYKINEFNLEKRDFLIKTTTILGIFGTCYAIYPLLKTFAPANDTILQSTIEVDLSTIKIGTTKVVQWQGKPVFIKHRTPEEIMNSINADISKLKDPQLDNQRIKPGHPEWLVTIGICTHLGCIPKSVETGWFCPCHGSNYDASGRIISGPAPRNLDIPKYEFISKNKIKIG
ncbi:MAG: ubiquinol-cytochrome c reductase iron-sulfur subunit [Rickettsiales bacterium]